MIFISTVDNESNVQHLKCLELKYFQTEFKPQVFLVRNNSIHHSNNL